MTWMNWSSHILGNHHTFQIICGNDLLGACWGSSCFLLRCPRTVWPSSLFGLMMLKAVKVWGCHWMYGVYGVWLSSCLPLATYVSIVFVCVSWCFLHLQIVAGPFFSAFHHLPLEIPNRPTSVANAGCVLALRWSLDKPFSMSEAPAEYKGFLSKTPGRCSVNDSRWWHAFFCCKTGSHRYQAK